jgi:hypothetical protein
MVFAFLFAFYFGMIVFAPVLLLLFIDSLRKTKIRIVAVSAVAVITTTASLLYISGYTTGLFLQRFAGTESHVVPFFQPDGVWQGYTMFSYRHLVEFVNLHLLLSPFALILFVVLLSGNYKALPWRSAEWIFLLTNACCGLIMIAIFQCDIGMSRDWDLLAVFGLGTVVTVAYLISHTFRDTEIKRRVFLIVALVTLIHSMGYVLVNADKDRAIPRFKTLLANSLWGTKAFSV